MFRFRRVAGLEQQNQTRQNHIDDLLALVGEQSNQLREYESIYQSRLRELNRAGGDSFHEDAAERSLSIGLRTMSLSESTGSASVVNPHEMAIDGYPSSYGSVQPPARQTSDGDNDDVNDYRNRRLDEHAGVAASASAAVAANPQTLRGYTQSVDLQLAPAFETLVPPLPRPPQGQQVPPSSSDSYSTAHLGIGLESVADLDGDELV